MSAFISVKQYLYEKFDEINFKTYKMVIKLPLNHPLYNIPLAPIKRKISRFSCDLR